MLRSSTARLVVLGVLTLVGFGSNVQRTIAQTQYPFETIYDAETTLTPIMANILKITNLGESVNAPYGLTQLMNISYGEFNPNTGVLTTGSDPVKFGLKDLPPGNLTLFGQGKDKLFGTVNGTATFDFQNLVGRVTNTITITGGSGRFSGATGRLDLLEENITLTNPDLTGPVKALPLIKGSFQTFQTIPEPNNTTTLICMGVIGAVFLLRQQRRRAASG